MFGFLKKKLKESIGKISRKVEEVEGEEKLEKIRVKVEKPGEEKEAAPGKKGTGEREPEKIERKAPGKKPQKEEPAEPKEGKPEKKERKLLKLRKKKPEEKAGEIVKEEKPKKFGLKKRSVEEKDIKALLWDLQVSLLESDVALETAEKICSDLKKNLVGKEIKKKEIESAVKENIKKSLFDILDQKPMDLVREVDKKSPFVILFLGFNGSGKTTAIARVAYLLKKNGFKVNMAAGDTWRAAAINQLEKHGEKLKVPVVKHDYGADSAAVIFDAVKHAKARKLDVVLADTAGRTHTNVNLMRELEKIIKVNKPDLKILVVDSLTGNDAVEQARSFEETVGVDGIILTKMDVNEKGGAALSVSHTIKKPIIYIGTGQEYKDLEKFNPRKIIQSLLE
ncbi:MAG: signal recognition particle-docking protein FtsY [archaeon]|nr:MAG: signal recognition particle-docking protein FtsY [archaeon]